MAVWPARTPSLPALEGSSHRRCHRRLLKLTRASGIGLETSILFAKEGANVLMADISEAALEKAQAKVKQLVPSAGRVEIIVSLTPSLTATTAR